MPFWLVSLPLIDGRKDRSWETLQERSTSLSVNAKLEIPELRVGTLDTLMQLSDDLTKTNNLMDAVVSKLRRQVAELAGHQALSGLRVGGYAVDQYVMRFRWNEAKYQAKRPLRELVEAITDGVARIDDDLKVKVADYNNLKGQLGAVARKNGGTLAVRDINAIVKPQQVVESENMTTLFVVVSKYSIKDWETSYETMCNFVVPRSSRMITEDNDYVLYSAVLFKRVLDDFKMACRTRGFQVKEYREPSTEAGDLTEEQVKQLERDVQARRGLLEQWSRTAFDECFSCWVHLIVIRLFVESILRYGLPPAFQAAAIVPSEKSEQKLRQALNAAFAQGNADMWIDDGTNAFAGLAGESELFPYVSFTISND